jgi:hypothetical protein
MADAAHEMELYGVDRVGDTEYRLPDEYGDWFFRQHPSGAGWYAVCPEGANGAEWDGFPLSDDHGDWDPHDPDKQRLFPTPLAGPATTPRTGCEGR